MKRAAEGGFFYRNKRKGEKSMEEMTVHEPTEMERLALEREQTLRQREAALEMRERRARAQELLTQRNLPAELTDCLNFSDDESLEKSLNALEKAFLEQVDKAVGERMKGAAPRSGENALYAGQLRSALGLK
ncbi:MAG: DUF4355 domain-containing protein [Eubacteriales bacterium]|nr:DUF4355 domain-containing protein [Eubacteriales bacterium]